MAGVLQKVHARRSIGIAPPPNMETPQDNVIWHQMYFSGRGVLQDYRLAARWLRAAAEKGLPAAQNNLAFMYYSGTGVPQDYSEAAKWTRRAAEQGYALAETDLGYLYEQGKGVPLDYTTAYMWYSIAARGGDSRSLERMKSLLRLDGGQAAH